MAAVLGREAHEVDGATAPDEVDRGLDGGRDAGTLEHQVGAGADGGEGFARRDRLVGAEVEGQGPPVVVRFDGDEPAGAVGLRALQGEEADGPAALHHDGVAEPDRGAVHGVERHRGGLDDRRLLVGEGVEHGDEALGGVGHLRRERAVRRREGVTADEAHERREAPLGLAGAAGIAGTARRGRPGHDPIALPDVADPFADGGDRAAQLVPADGRVVGLGRQEAVEVGAADPAQRDVDDRRARLGRRGGELDQLEAALAGDQTGFHASAFMRWPPRRPPTGRDPAPRPTPGPAGAARSAR